MRIFRSDSIPTLVMFMTIGGYSLIRAPAGERLSMFAMLIAAAFGAIEFVRAGRLLFERSARRVVTLHLLNACGASLMSYSYVAMDEAIPFAFGAIFFATGMLMWQQHLRMHADTGQATGL
ncbi:MAG: hypothetical protein WD825_12635 [Gemmatimonadaceae bacterium]